MSQYRNSASELKYCIICKEYVNVRDINEVRTHDYLCPPQKRASVFKKQRVEHAELNSEKLTRNRNLKQITEGMLREYDNSQKQSVPHIPHSSKYVEKSRLQEHHSHDYNRSYMVNEEFDQCFEELSDKNHSYGASTNSIGIDATDLTCAELQQIYHPSFSLHNNVEEDLLIDDNLEYEEETSNINPSSEEAENFISETIFNEERLQSVEQGTNNRDIFSTLEQQCPNDIEMCSSSTRTRSPSSTTVHHGKNPNEVPEEFNNEKYLLYIQSAMEKRHSKYHYTPREKCYMELAQIVNSMNLPSRAYDEIIKWAQRSKPKDLMHPIGKKTLIKNLAVVCNMSRLFPFYEKLSLPSGSTMKVTKFDFAAQLLSLLNDKELMRGYNLILDGNLFKKATLGNVRADVDSGEWFVRTQEKLCTKENDILCPIILYIDKTHVDNNIIEAISFTLGIFKRSVRYLPQSWRNIGTIPGLLNSLIPVIQDLRKDLGRTHLRDWHYVVKWLLSDLYDLQQKEYLEWYYMGKKVRLFIPIMFIIGDIEGHDKICCRKHGHHVEMNGVTHSCSIHRKDCDNPNAKCRLLRAKEIKELQELVTQKDVSDEVRRKAKESLDQKSFHWVDANIFFDLDYGSNENGVHGACAICLLHTFEMKFPDLVLDEYRAMFGVSEDTMGKLEINASVGSLMNRCKRKSDRDFPLINTFSFALTKGRITYTAKERFARIFALYLFCMTSFGWNFNLNSSKRSYSETIVKKVVKLIEKTLTIHEYLYQEEFRISGNSRNRRTPMGEIISYMHDLKAVLGIGDPENSRCKFPKFHYLLHVIPLIILYGCVRNFDGGHCERHHKYISKQPGKQTQRRRETFDEQTSFNFASKIVLEKSCRDANILTSWHRSKHMLEVQQERCLENNDIQEGNIEINVTSSKFILRRNNEDMNSSLLVEWKNGPKKRRQCFAADILDYVNQEIFIKYGLVDETISGFTSLDWKGEIIRADPSFKLGTSWFDYVTLRWEADVRRGEVMEYFCPAKILMFLDLRNISLDNDGCRIQPSIYAVVHSTKTNENDFGPEQKAKRIWETRGKSSLVTYWTMEEGKWLVPVNAISSTSFVYQDYDDKEMENKTEYVIEVKARKEWCNAHL